MRRFVLALVVAVAVAAMPSPSLTGTWSGMLAFPSTPLLFVVTFSQSGDALSAIAASPYQTGATFPLENVTLQGDRLHFAAARLHVVFDGTVANGAISGTFTQNATSLPLTLLPSSLGTSDLAGTWLGSLHAPGANLLLAYHFAHAAGGGLTATLDSPFQSGYAIPVASVTAADGRLTIAMPNLHATFIGAIGPQTIAGSFTQNGVALPLTLSRPMPGADIATPAPPQTPVPTAPPHFTSEDVTFSSIGGATLAGTITVPEARRGRLAAFVFVHGSGPGTRNAAQPQNPTFLDLSNALSNAGYIVLRYDKRGIGESTGTPTEDWRVLGADVRAAVAFLRRRSDVDPHRIVLLGHSEGGLVVPLVANAARAEGIVLMAPPAVSIFRILDEQAPRGSTQLLQAERRAFAAYAGIDPANVIRSVSAPILVLQGTHDIQVLPSDLHHLVDAARAAHRRITVDMLTGDDHLFLHVAPGTPNDASEYKVASPLDPRVASDILGWMRANHL